MALRNTSELVGHLQIVQGDVSLSLGRLRAHQERWAEKAMTDEMPAHIGAALRVVGASAATADQSAAGLLDIGRKLRDRLNAMVAEMEQVLVWAHDYERVFLDAARSAKASAPEGSFRV